MAKRVVGTSARTYLTTGFIILTFALGVGFLFTQTRPSADTISTSCVHGDSGQKTETRGSGRLTARFAPGDPSLLTLSYEINEPAAAITLTSTSDLGSTLALQMQGFPNGFKIKEFSPAEGASYRVGHGSHQQYRQQWRMTNGQMLPAGIYTVTFEGDYDESLKNSSYYGPLYKEYWPTVIALGYSEIAADNDSGTLRSTAKGFIKINTADLSQSSSECSIGSLETVSVTPKQSLPTATTTPPEATTSTTPASQTSQSQSSEATAQSSAASTSSGGSASEEAASTSESSTESGSASSTSSSTSSSPSSSAQGKPKASTAKSSTASSVSATTDTSDAEESAPAETTKPINADLLSEVTVNAATVDLAVATPPEVTKTGTIVLKGKAQPNETVTLYVYSDPKTFTTTADGEGNWTYELSAAELESGSHKVEVESPSITRTQALEFTVAQAAPIDTTPSLTTSSVETRAGISLSWLWWTLGAVVILGGLFFVFRRRQPSSEPALPAETSPIGESPAATVPSESSGALPVEPSTSPPPAAPPTTPSPPTQSGPPQVGS